MTRRSLFAALVGMAAAPTIAKAANVALPDTSIYLIPHMIHCCGRLAGVTFMASSSTFGTPRYMQDQVVKVECEPCGFVEMIPASRFARGSR